MIQRIKINLEELKKEAEMEGCKTIEFTDRSYVIDPTGIIIATSEGAIVVKLEQFTELKRELAVVSAKLQQEVARLTLEEKIRLAKKKDISYGTLKATIERIGGENVKG